MLLSKQDEIGSEPLPEYIREPADAGDWRSAWQHGGNEHNNSVEAVTNDDNKDSNIDNCVADSTAHVNIKHDALDALWTGGSSDIFMPVKRSVSFYLTLGFMAGALVSSICVFVYQFFVNGWTGHRTVSVGKHIVVAASYSANGNTQRRSSGPLQSAGVIVPEYSSYIVKDGDTLAAIALKAYKRVSPRLLDTVCRANHLSSADVLKLGQQLVLPDYHLLPEQGSH